MRFTTDDPKSNLESALNLFYAKDGEAWVRGGGPEPSYDDVTLFVFIRRVIKELLQGTSSVEELDNDTLSEIMFDWLQDGPESIPGVIALLYETAWAFAEIREKLKSYEDSGLTPGEVMEAKGIAGKEAAFEINKIITIEGTSIQRLKELAEAEKEGRIAIMPPPAKAGDPIPRCYYNENGGIWCNAMAPADGDEPTERCKQCWYCEFGYEHTEEA